MLNKLNRKTKLQVILLLKVCHTFCEFKKAMELPTYTQYAHQVWQHCLKYLQQDHLEISKNIIGNYLAS